MLEAHRNQTSNKPRKNPETVTLTDLRDQGSLAEMPAWKLRAITISLAHMTEYRPVGGGVHRGGDPLEGKFKE